MYDNNNIFAKIIRKEISCDTVYDDDKVLFFYDLYPQAKIHILGIPKIPVVDFTDFILKANKETVEYFFSKINYVIEDLGINKTGFKIITNNGKDANQEVPHFHVHILGGENLGVLK